MKRMSLAPLALVTALLGCDGVSDSFVEPVAEAPVLLEEVVSTPAAVHVAPKAGSGGAVPRRGVVTAGDIDDGLNLAAFQRYQSRTAQRLKLPQLNLAHPLRLHITDHSGRPAPETLVYIRKAGAAAPFLSMQAGIDGNLTIFPRAMGAGHTRQFEVEAIGADGSSVRQRIKAGAARTQIKLTKVEAHKPDFLDLVFVIDVSGSMAAWMMSLPG